MVLVASRGVFSLSGHDEDVFANAQLWNTRTFAAGRAPRILGMV
jgi:hypothetical protein